MRILEKRYPETGIHGRVVHEIGREIVSGILKSGDKLPKEAEIMGRFDGSRTAIREAMRVLSAKGLLEARQKAGTVVRARSEWNLLDPDVLAWQSPETASFELIRDLIELRIMIEPRVARLVAERATEEELDRIEHAYNVMVSAEEKGLIDDFFEADLSFHLEMFEACHNELVIHLSSIVRTILVFAFKYQGMMRKINKGAAASHYSILEKLRQRDAGGAELAMQGVISRGKDELEALLALLKEQKKDAAE